MFAQWVQCTSALWKGHSEQSGENFCTDTLKFVIFPHRPLRLALATCLSLLPRIPFITVHAESLTLKNITRENVNELEKSQIACATSDRPVNHTVNHIIPRVGNYKYFSCSGLVYTTPEKFENGGFIKCFPSTLPRRNLKSNEHSRSF